MNPIFAPIPLEVREEVAKRSYMSQFPNNRAYPVCADGRCPFGVALFLMFKDAPPYRTTVYWESYKQPRASVIARELLVDQTAVEDWTFRWDHGMISAQELAEDLGVSV